MPVITPVERDHHLALDDAAERLLAIIRPAREPKPQHIHRRSEFVDVQLSLFPHDRTTAIGAYSQISANFQRTVRRLRLDADDLPFFFQQIDHFRFHQQLEGWIALAPLGKKIEKVPLRHQRDEFAFRG